MIFLSVGTAHLPFDSLLKVIDEYVSSNKLDILAQIGYSTYEPNHFKWFRFTSHKEILEHINSAELVIAHGGLAIIGECLRAEKPLVVVPRTGEEAVNPQIELVQHLSDQHYLDYVNLPTEIIAYLSGEKVPVTKPFTLKTRIPEIVNEYVNTILSGN